MELTWLLVLTLVLPAVWGWFVYWAWLRIWAETPRPAVDPTLQTRQGRLPPVDYQI